MCVTDPWLIDQPQENACDIQTIEIQNDMDNVCTSMIIISVQQMVISTFFLIPYLVIDTYILADSLFCYSVTSLYFNS